MESLILAVVVVAMIVVVVRFWLDMRWLRRAYREHLEMMRGFNERNRDHLDE